MKKRMAVLSGLLSVLLTLLCAGTALAENFILHSPPVSDIEKFSGEWVVSYKFNGTSFAGNYSDTRMSIGKDGTITSDLRDLSGTLTVNPETGGYTVSHYDLTMDDFGTLFVLNRSTNDLYICQKPWKSTFSMPSTLTQTYSTGGTWQISHIKYQYEVSYWFRDRPWIELSRLGIEPLTLQLAPHAGSSDVADALKQLISSHKDTNTLAAILKDKSFTGVTLHSEGVILLETGTSYKDTSKYEICLTRVDTPTLGEEVSTIARRMMGAWVITDLTMGSFTIPADSFKDDYLLQIDEYGYVKLGEDPFTLAAEQSSIFGLVNPAPTLTLRSDAYNAKDLRLAWSEESICITDPESNVQFSFITFAEAHWRSLCGSWSISRLQLHNVGLDVTPERTIFTLTLYEDHTATLKSGSQQESFTVLFSEDVNNYILQGPQQQYHLQFYGSEDLILYTQDQSLYMSFQRPTNE